MTVSTSFAIIGHVESDFPTKFGIPRQSGLVASLSARVVFEPAYRSAEAVRGLEEFSHIWLIWGFSAVPEHLIPSWSPTVRPPRLGGTRRMGVFATRSPFRPNPLGLSCVRLTGVEYDTVRGPVLDIAGGDMMDGTPVYDIKPYLPYTDCRTDAASGFAAQPMALLAVDIPPHLAARVPPTLLTALRGVLAQDPRPSYHVDAARIYGMSFGGLEVKFVVQDNRLTVTEIENHPTDNHLIEVGESMKSVVERLQTEGMSLTEIAERMDVTESDVNNMLRG
jgi:tRNA-Thr(GGU) m(6)t(6)A37 methyltransferase TsaA